MIDSFNHARTTPIARRPHNAPPTRDTGPRTNDRIRVPEIRLIGAEGENIGVVTPARGMALAEEAGLRLKSALPSCEPEPPWATFLHTHACLSPI